jgi:hypothetical protein
VRSFFLPAQYPFSETFSGLNSMQRNLVRRYFTEYGVFPAINTLLLFQSKAKKIDGKNKRSLAPEEQPTVSPALPSGRYLSAVPNAT